MAVAVKVASWPPPHGMYAERTELSIYWAVDNGGKAMRNQELRERTKQFALRLVRMACSLPKRMEADVLGKPALRAGTSVAANFREASRARSTAEFIAKLGVVEQELDETLLWLELLVESKLVPSTRMSFLHQEADELLRIIVSSIKKAKRTKRPPSNSEFGIRNSEGGIRQAEAGPPNSNFRIPNSLIIETNTPSSQLANQLRCGRV